MLGAAELPRPAEPDGLGIDSNIPWANPELGDLHMLTRGGFRWIRFDLFWKGMECHKGVYDCDGHDELIATLETHHLRAMVILCHSNPLCDNGQLPASDGGEELFRVGRQPSFGISSTAASSGKCITNRTTRSSGRPRRM